MVVVDSESLAFWDGGRWVEGSMGKKEDRRKNVCLFEECDTKPFAGVRGQGRNENNNTPRAVCFFFEKSIASDSSGILW